MSLIHDIMMRLADGKRHSGVALAEDLGVSRAAVSKAVSLCPHIPISVQRGGYALPQMFYPLAQTDIAAQLAGRGGAPVAIEIHEELASTNKWLLDQPGPVPRVCLAERQSAGRGRRGRSWHATPYGNVLLSLVWAIPVAAQSLGVLSLAAGVAVLRAVQALGAVGVGLKWPNDVLWAGRKLAGILIEVRGEGGALRVVVGVGLNVAMGPMEGARIDQDWVDLRTIVGTVDRNQVAAGLIFELMGVMQGYCEGRACGILAEWRAHHAWAGRLVRVHEEGRAVALGTVLDVTEEGALVLEMSGSRRLLRAGEVSLRPL